MTGVFIIELLTFGFVVWLGSYLISRDHRNPLIYNTGIGAISYGFVLALFTLSTISEAPPQISRIGWSLLVIPPFFWAVALLHLSATDSSNLPEWTSKATRIGLILNLAIAIGLLFVPLFWNAQAIRPTSTGLVSISTWLIAPVITGAFTVSRIAKSHKPALSGIRAALIATLFFFLGSSLIIFPLEIFPPLWVMIAIALDFELLGISVAWLDAFDLGERLLPDFLRSLIVSTIVAALFGSQIGFVIALSTGPTCPLLLILHLTIMAAIAVSVFSDELQNLVESRFVLANNEREGNLNLRGAARALVRISRQPGALQDEEAFYKHTRQALSNFGNLPKLISNPLLYLPLVSKTIEDNKLLDSPLERAKVLKSLLAQAVARLKPAGDKNFDETDEWRFYNALYFPYIIGLHPYRRKTVSNDLDEDARMALDWIRTSVPERTLYNWQNAAARLVAQQLNELNNRA